MDKITIKDLEIFANHGVLKEENALGQKFIASVNLYCDFTKAVQTDNVEYSTNYADVCERINSFLKEQTFSLIETAAKKTALMLLREYPLIERVEIELKKPWAPIGYPLEYVSVTTEEKRHTAYISLGSNLGDRKGYLDFAVSEIKKDKMCQDIKVSDYFETKPIGGVEQDNFLNACMCIKTLYNPYELLDFVNGIEKQAKRERKIHWGPRTLDIDIIFYDDLIINEKNLIIPHKEAENRGFVMIPLKQLAPFLVHPVSKRTVSEIADSLEL